MNLLFLQFANPLSTRAGAGTPQPVFSHAIGVLSAMLEAEGFERRLLTLSDYQAHRLRQACEGGGTGRPDHVLVELSPHNVTAAHRTIAELARMDMPVTVFGPYATCKPTEAASIPGVRALALGEYGAPLRAYLTALRDGEDAPATRGMWIHTDSGLVRNRLAPLATDLDALPWPDRELFGYGAIVADTHEASFKVGRGCPMWCAYCVNDWYMELYSRHEAPFVRRRSVTHLLDEIAEVIRTYPRAERIVFHDHAFAMDVEWLREFRTEYPKRCALPFRCHVRLGKVTAETAALLADAGCQVVETHLGSGSRFIREEILSMHLSDARIIDACRALHHAGLRITADVFIGAPYESEITVEETLDLLRTTGVDEVRGRVFYPTPGTRAAELCAENGWIRVHDDRCYWARRSVLGMPSMPAEQIDAVAEKLRSLVKRPRSTALRKVLERAIRPRRSGRFGLGR